MPWWTMIVATDEHLHRHSPFCENIRSGGEFPGDNPSAGGNGEPFAYSHLHELEIPNAIRLKRFRGEITKTQETAAIRAFLGDVDAGRFERIAYDLAAVFIRAEQLSAKWSAEIGCRSLDLWHVAAALEVGCATFVSYDARQRKAAEMSSLHVLPALSG